MGGLVVAKSQQVSRRLGTTGKERIEGALIDVRGGIGIRTLFWLDRCSEEAGERQSLVAEIYPEGQAKHLVEDQLPESNGIVGMRTDESQRAEGNPACQGGRTLGKSLRLTQQRDRS